MTNIEINIERDRELMQLLAASEIKYLVVHTDKGELSLVLRSREDNYRFVLDNTPVDDDLNYRLINFFQ